VLILVLVLMLNVSFSCTKVPPLYRQSVQPKQRGGESEGVEYKSIERKAMKEGKEKTPPCLVSMRRKMPRNAYAP
jgi:hypothetical protein